MSKYTKDPKVRKKPEISLSPQPTIAKKPRPTPGSSFYKKLFEELAKTKGISPVKLVEEIKDNQKVLQPRPQPAAPNLAYEASTASVEPGSQRANDVVLSSQGGGYLGAVDYGLADNKSTGQPDLETRTGELRANDLDVNGSLPTPLSTVPRPQSSS